MNVEAECDGECIQKQGDSFSTYDFTVDILSTLECFFKRYFKEETAFFDRFPELTPNKRKPEFTACLKEGVIMIGEITRSLPNNEEGFDKELKQLLSYDEELGDIKTSKDTTTSSKKHDIILLLSSTASAEIVSRIQDKITKKEITFKNNLVFFEYFYQGRDRAPRYIIRKFTGFNNKLTNEKLEGIFKRGINMRLEEMTEFKTNGVICNDKPPEVYLAVYLWMNVFYELLSLEQKQIWQEKKDTKILEIKTTVDDLTNLVNTKFIKDAKIEKTWVEETLKFMVAMGMAKAINAYTFTIYFRNIVSRVKDNRTQFSEVTEKDGIWNELRNIFIHAYCKKGQQHLQNDSSTTMELEESELTQKKLGEF